MKKYVILTLLLLLISCKNNEIMLIQKDKIEEVVFYDFDNKSLIDISINHCANKDWHQFYLHDLKIKEDTKALFFNYRVDTGDFEGKEYLILCHSRSGVIISKSNMTELIANRYKFKILESYEKNNIYFTYFAVAG